MSPKEVSLRTAVAKGVAYLTVRNAVAALLGFIGTFFIARVLGPSAQGLYYSALNIQGYLLLVLGMKDTNYMIIESKKDENIVNLVFTWHFLISLPIGLVGCALAFFAFLGTAKDFSLLKYLSILTISIPITLLKTVFIAYMETQLDYKRVSTTEMVSQFAYYVVAIGLIALGFGGLSLAMGTFVSEVVGLGLSVRFARYLPKWYWNVGSLREMLKISFAQALPGWIQNLDRLSLPFIVLPIAGASAVGYANLVERFIGVLSFPKGAVGRVSLPALSAIQDDKQRMNRSINEAMRLQTFLMGLIYALFAIVSFIFLPIVLGSKWDTRILGVVFAFLATRSLISGFTALQETGVVVLKKNHVLLIARILYLLSFIFFILTFVFILPAPVKAYAYGIAGVMGVLIGGLVRHWGYTKYIGKPNYSITLSWSIAAVSAFFAPYVSWWLYGVTAVLVLTPSSRNQIRVAYKMFRDLIKTRKSNQSGGSERNFDSSTDNP